MVNVVAQYNGRPKRGRKLKVPNQSRVDRKKLCNTNKPHINSKGEAYQQKVFDEHFECDCRRKCTEVVPIKDRRRLFSQYWSQGSYPGRVALLNACMRKDSSKNRENARIYSIYDTVVCQKTLLKTLCICDKRLSSARQKYLESDSLSDLRGTLIGGWNALPPSKREEVRAHINSFPRYVSHYTREKTESKYLDTDLNLAKLYALYKEGAHEPVSKSYYNRVFWNDFNLRFKQPKMDTCHKCDIYKVEIQLAVGARRQQLEECHQDHLDMGECFQAQMKADMAAAKIDDKLESISYDIQKTLKVLRIATSIAYYKRNLNLYNMGIHTGSTGEGKFNLWIEDEASKGTQEVGSCLKLHIESSKKQMETLIMWSDSCGGQNRSIKLVLMMMYVLQNHKTLKTISMRYLLSGHSFLPNDTEFGEAETALRKKELFTDEMYMETMRNCRTRNKFVVNRMSPENFFSVNNLEALITNRKVDVNKRKVSWLNTHEILIEKDHPGFIKMSEKIGGPYQIVNLQKVGCQLDLKDVVLGSLWPAGRPLSKEKIKDLKDMLELVPAEYREFYTRLDRVPGGDFVDCIDGFGESCDFDVEYTSE